MKVVLASKNTLGRDTKKLEAFHRIYSIGGMSIMELWASVNGMMAYLESYNEHWKVLTLRRKFYALFGFSCEKNQNFIVRAT